MRTLPIALCLSALSDLAAPSPRERASLDDDWRFTKGDPPGVALAYDNFPTNNTVRPLLLNVI